MKHFITAEQARLLTGQFRRRQNELLMPELRGKDVLPLSETFDRTAFDALLRQPGCTSLRIYLGLDATDKIRLVIAGVNEKDEDIVATSASELQTETGIILEDGMRCPPDCPQPSYLNSDDETIID